MAKIVSSTGHCDLNILAQAKNASHEKISVALVRTAEVGTNRGEIDLIIRGIARKISGSTITAERSRSGHIQLC